MLVLDSPNVFHVSSSYLALFVGHDDFNKLLTLNYA